MVKQQLFDTIIIGSGPAGFAAGIYASRGGLKALLIECFLPASQAVTADLIENYPGFTEGIGGFALIDNFKNQAKKFGLEFQTGKVEKIILEDRKKNIWQVKAEEKIYNALSVILAVGTRPRVLGVRGEEEFRGKGVSYCAVCDGAFFKDKDIVVVGGGNTAVEEALYLRRFARKIILVHRRSRLRADSILAKRVKQDQKIELMLNSIVTQLYGKNQVEGIILENVVDKKESRIACNGVFISVGYEPNTDFLKEIISLDDSGYITTDERMQTSTPGIFACGDCRVKPLRQVVTACSDGAIAASSTIEYVDRLKGQAYDG